MIGGKRPNEQDNANTTSAKQPRLSKGDKSADKSSSATVNMRTYKSNLKFNPKWREKWGWIDYQPTNEGMFCAICREYYGKAPPSTRAVWVSKPVSNWDWHLVSVEVQAMASVARKSGDIVEWLLAAGEKEKKKNRALIKMLVRSLYFPVKHRIAHTNTFEDFIHLQIDNGREQLKVHKQSCPSNATLATFLRLLPMSF